LSRRDLFRAERSRKRTQGLSEAGEDDALPDDELAIARELEAQKQGTPFGTCVNIIKNVVGAGILSLPNSFYVGGFGTTCYVY
jgi:hypothetical protein